MSKKMRNIPKLRFPEFRDTAEWEEKPLGDIFDFLRGSLFSKADIVQNGANKCIHYGELFTTYKEKISEIKSSTNLENGQFSQNGDILMPSSDVTPEGLATASAIFETGVIIGGDVNILRPKNQVSSLYVSYLLNFSKKEIMKLVTGTTVKHIYNKDVARLEIRIPPRLEEQQKIADCLSSIDELITSQAAKVEALKEHKKALMQRLFPREGETVPRLRFPEFQNAPEWEEKEVGKLIFIVTPPKKLLTSQYCDKGKFPIIDQSQNYIAGWTDDAEAAIKSFSPLIVFGDHTCALKIVRTPFAQGADGIKIFYADSELLSTDYLYQFLQFEPVKMEEYKRHFSILKLKKIKFPDKKSGEQQKIADCLSSIDELITSQTAKVEALKEHKKALMQRLFPSSNEK